MPLGPPQTEHSSTCWHRAQNQVIFVLLELLVQAGTHRRARYVLRSKCSNYMAVRTRSGRRSGATPLNGGADSVPYEWKLDALLTVFYLAVLYYWR